MEHIKLSPPWITFANEVKALFDRDKEVIVTFDENDNSLKLFVDNEAKADALTKLLPEKKDFGNIVVTITVIPSNREKTQIDLFKDAFAGNPVMSFATAYDTPFGNINYVVFEKRVVQFFNDQMNDINQNKTTLYENIARDVFGSDAKVYFCTDADDPNNCWTPVN